MSIDAEATIRRRDLRADARAPRAEESAPPAPVPPRPPRRRVPWRVRLRAWRTRARAFLEPRLEALRPAWTATRGVLASVGPLGWTVLAMALIGWVLAARFGWQEAAIAAATLLVLFAISCLFTIGRTNLDFDLAVDPRRVVVGESAAGRIGVRNVAGLRLLPLAIECRVGVSVARFTLPPLAGGATHEEVMVIPTSRRGVVPVGPVRTLRGDPFGIVRRELAWTEQLELFVHPRTVPLAPVGSGLLRDLEGYTTNDVSMSDLAFHTLREYAPGDDRRYIHWRSSAKATAAAGTGTFLVRQFLDTRRSHIAVVTDVDETSYAGEPEFELAVSAAASIALRTLADEMDLTIVCGEHAASEPPPYLALDTYARAAWSHWTLPAATGKLNSLAPDASVVVLVTGSRQTFEALQQSRAYLPPEVNTFVVQVSEGGPMTMRQALGLTLLTIGNLADLPRVLQGGQIQ